MKNNAVRKLIYIITTLLILAGTIVLIIGAVESFKPYDDFLAEYAKLNINAHRGEIQETYEFITFVIRPFYVVSYVLYGGSILLSIILIISHYLSDSGKTHYYFVLSTIMICISTLVISLWQFRILNDQDPSKYYLGTIDIIQIVLLSATIVLGIVSYVLKWNQVNELFINIFGALSSGVLLISLTMSFLTLIAKEDYSIYSWLSGSFFTLYSISTLSFYSSMVYFKTKQLITLL